MASRARACPEKELETTYAPISQRGLSVLLRPQEKSTSPEAVILEVPLEFNRYPSAWVTVETLDLLIGAKNSFGCLS